VYYCRKPLSLTKPILSLDTHADSEIPDTVDKQQSSNALPSTSLGDDQIIRTEAKISSNAAATKMVQQHFSRNLPSEYAEGDDVLVRLRQRHSQIKGKKCSAKTVCYQGKVIKKGVHGLEYTIEYTKDGEIKTGHFGVSDLTSLTVAEEKRRPKLSAQNALVTRDNSKVQPITKSAPSKPLSMSTLQNSLSNSKGKSVSADSDTIGSNPMFSVFGPSKRIFYDLRYSDLRDITSKTAWISNWAVSIFTLLLLNCHDYIIQSEYIVVPVDFHDAIASQMKLSHSIWEQFSISVECVAPKGHKQLCIPVLEHSHFF
jgi:hypothetical protein